MPKQLANKLVKKFKTNNPFYIAKNLGIHVLFESLGSIYGYYNYYKRIKIIHINEQLDESLQRFTCAHELGHALLHHDINTTFLKSKTFFSTDKIEREANTFAVELLMPDEYLYELKDTGLTIYDAAEMYGVPKEVCLLKDIFNNYC
jgi:Zn-dependent peptidase ImmA (M78 family)